MTPRQADKVIKGGKPMKVRDAYGEEFIATFVNRNRFYIESAEGGKFERADLQLVKSTGATRKR